MGIFIDKILKPIFLSKESNWIRRLDEMSTGQLDVAHNGDGDGIAFASALDGMVDIKTAKPIHKIALKNPEKLSKKEMLEYFEHTFLIMANITRHHKTIPGDLLMYGTLQMHASHGFLMGAIGMICFPETRKKGFQVWKYLYECFPLCKKFNYKKHLPKELVKLLEVGVFDK
jgi:hypothetical protein